MVNENKLVIYNGMGKEETVKNLTTAQKKDITDANSQWDDIKALKIKYLSLLPV